MQPKREICLPVFAGAMVVKRSSPSASLLPLNGHVRAGAAIHPLLRDNFHRAGETGEAPLLDLAAYPT